MPSTQGTSSPAVEKTECRTIVPPRNAAITHNAPIVRNAPEHRAIRTERASKPEKLLSISKSSAANAAASVPQREEPSSIT